jgi:ZIP family zinc transporter
MPEPLTSSGAPLRSLFARFSDSGWGGRAFWSILIGVTVFLLISGYGAFVGTNKANLYFAFLGGLSGFAATAFGAVAAIALRNITARTLDIMLGFAAGMMLAASSFSLILPGIEAAQALCGNQLLAACVVVAGLGLGVALMVGLDRFVPHEHEKSGRRGPDAQRINRV